MPLKEVLFDYNRCYSSTGAHAHAFSSSCKQKLKNITQQMLPFNSFSTQVSPDWTIPTGPSKVMKSLWHACIYRKQMSPSAVVPARLLCFACSICKIYICREATSTTAARVCIIHILYCGHM